MSAQHTVADGFVTVQVPDGWEVAEDPAQGIELVAVAPEDGGLFRANLVLAVADVAMSFADWQKGTDVYLSRELRDHLILDLEKLSVGEPRQHPAGRRLATYATVENESVTMQQWSALVDGRGVTLTATCGTLAFAATTQLEEAAASLRVGGLPLVGRSVAQ